MNGPNEIKAHVWFKEFDFSGLLARKLQSPYVPSIRKQNFDKKTFVLRNDEIETPMQQKLNEELMAQPNV